MGVAEKIDPGASGRKILSPLGRWTEFARDGQVAGARAAAVAVGMWKSRIFVFGAISKRGGKRGKIREPVSLRRWRSVGLFHAFHGASFPQQDSHCPSQSGAFGRRPRRRRFGLRDTGQPRVFSQEVKS